MKTGYGYKLFEMDMDGKLYPLFIGKNKETKIGVWIPAEDGSHFCSECGHTALWKNSGSMVKEYCSDICPYCGALMTCDNEDARCV